ncbi:MAG: hypothetical protein IPF83_00830 [Rhodanobacteraceae bacterium]|nr:hypothetical protein [Rhodanobacteraceae bacterium]
MRRLFVCLSFCLSFCPSVSAQSVIPMADLNDGPNGFLSGGMGTSSVFFDNRIVFVGTDRLHGTELWVTDGTPTNTTRLTDICPGQCSSTPSSLYVEGSSLYFAANDGRQGNELWRLQTGSNVPTLVADINPGADGSSPAGFVRKTFRIAGGLVTRTFFAATRATDGREVWRLSAGVPTLERDVVPGPASSDPRSFTVMNTLQIGFLGLTPSGGRDLYQLGYNSSADLSAVSATVLGGFNISTTRSARAEIVTLGSLTYVIVGDNGSFLDDLYATDGTIAGTTKLRTATQISGLVANASLFRMFYTARSGGNETLGVSDGTVAGTISLSATNLSPRAITSLGNRVFFTALTPSAGRELFRSDGTVAGTALFKELVPGAEGIPSTGFGMTTVNNLRAYFAFDDHLWITDGNLANTLEVFSATINGTGGKVTALIPTSAQNIMLGFDPSGFGSGAEPVFSNGTSAGTLALANLIGDVGDSFPTPLSVIGDRLVFAASIPGQTASTYSLSITGNGGLEPINVSGVANGGRHFGRLWLRTSNALVTTEGSAAGSTLLPVRAEVFDPDCVIVRNGIPHFIARGIGADTIQIWRSDGTPSGTVPVTNIPLEVGIGIDDVCFTEARRIGGFGDSVFVAGTLPSAPTTGVELLRLDANNQLTLVSDLRAGANGADIRDMVSLSDRIVLIADDGIFGLELWRSTGTAQGTVRLTDINPGAGSANIRQLTRVGNRVFFVATTPDSGTELYVSDGTPAGTLRVADLFSGVGSGLTATSLLVPAGDLLYFTAYSSSMPACQLFQTDGTQANTRCAYNAASVNLGPVLDAVVTASGAVVFTAVRFAPSDGEELRVLFNGQFIDIPGLNLGPDAAGSAPSDLIAEGDNVYFRANDSQTGFELWQLALPDLAAVFRNSFE